MRDKELAVKLNKIRYAQMSNDELQMHFDCASKYIRSFRNTQFSYYENGKMIRMRSLPFIIHEMRNREMAIEMSKPTF